ncbi:hypothetical protein KI387_025511, partial [Taxus chinensis]
LGAKFPHTFDHTLLTNMVHRDAKVERPLRIADEMLNPGFSSNFGQHNDKEEPSRQSGGHRILIVKINCDGNVEREDCEKPPSPKTHEENLNNDEIMVQQKLQALTFQLEILASH